MLHMLIIHEGSLPPSPFYGSNLVVPELNLLLHVVLGALDLTDALIVLLAQALNLHFMVRNALQLFFLFFCFEFTFSQAVQALGLSAPLVNDLPALGGLALLLLLQLLRGLLAEQKLKEG